MDSDLENMVRVCKKCQEHAKNPKASTPGTWSWPTGPWKRIHIDYAGPVRQLGGLMFLVIVDAYSKYLEIYPVKKADTAATIEKLRHLFSTFGLPEHLVSDNGTTFTSIFLNYNVIQHTRTAPGHPATNGLAERYVGHFKEAMKKMSAKVETVQEKLDRFLLTYRITPTNTGKSPAELLMNRKLRTRFSALRFSDTKAQVKIFQENMEHAPKYKQDDAVFAKNFGKGQDWMPGIVLETISPKSFLIQVNDVVWKRHVDQLRPRQIPVEQYKNENMDEQNCTQRLAGPETEFKNKPTSTREQQTGTESIREGGVESESVSNEMMDIPSKSIFTEEDTTKKIYR